MATLGSEWRLIRILITVAIVTAALYFAQTVFIPFALATLLSFLLCPLVTRIEHWGLRRVPAVLVVAVCTLGLTASLGWIALNQFVDLAENLPGYRVNIERNLQSLNGRTSVALSKATRILQELGQQTVLDKIPDENSQPPPNAPQLSTNVGTDRQSGPSVTVGKEPNLLDFSQDVIGPMLAPLGKGAIVMILVLFMLIGREELRDRLIRLLGTTHMNITIQALDDAGERVSRYLLTQFLINLVFGGVISIGLYFIGVPNAFMWGLMTAALRFIPYLGVWLGIAIPFILALASPTWFQPIATVLLFGTVELIANNLEPRIFGTSAGLSSVAILGATLFWAWLWGSVGLLLATPLTVLLVVMGRHVPRLAFLNMLLGNEPALKPHERLYQRMLATDNEETEELFEEFTKTKSLTEAYDAFALPALGLAEADYHIDQIDDIRRQMVHENMKELVQELGARHKREDSQDLPAVTDGTMISPEVSRLSSIPVMCFPARDGADEIASTMLVQILQAAYISIKSASVDLLASEMLEIIDRDGIEVICISAVPPSGLRHARYLYKRIRTKYPKIPIVVALWGTKLTPDKAMRLMGCREDDIIATTMESVAQHIQHLVDLSIMRHQASKKRAPNEPEAIRPSKASTLAPAAKDGSRS